MNLKALVTILERSIRLNCNRLLIIFLCLDEEPKREKVEVEVEAEIKEEKMTEEETN